MSSWRVPVDDDVGDPSPGSDRVSSPGSDRPRGQTEFQVICFPVPKVQTSSSELEADFRGGNYRQAKPVSRPWRRFLRFSVRGMIVLVLVIGGWLGWIVRSARIQREAVAAIENAGGRVAYDWEWSNGNHFPGGKPWGPGWLVDLIGLDYFGHVTLVVINFSPKVSVATTEQIGRLTRLECLNLTGSSAGDAELAHVQALTNLRFLLLGDTQVTDSGLVHLKGIANLSLLSLYRTQVTDAGLAQLKGLTNLTGLNLNGTQVTDVGLAQLKGLTNLNVLALDGTPVTDAGIFELKQTPRSVRIVR